MTLPRTSIRGIEWPPLPDMRNAALLGILWQLEQTEWWDPEDLAAAQAVQRAALLRHAATTTEHYAGLDPEDWSSVPILTRAGIIAARDRLASRAYPTQHGTKEPLFTSRTSGEPVRVETTGVLGTFWKAYVLRDHFWHGRDLSAHLAAIRYAPGSSPEGTRTRGWGPATEWLAPDAPFSVLPIDGTTEQHVTWLLREDPDYLLTYPTILDAIVRRLQHTGARLSKLREVRTISERLSPDTRELVREVLGVPIVDAYSAQEVGYIALQCPEHEHYHVMSERLIVEVLDEHDAPCPPGAIGRVVITDLHNFATPILRYEIGDHAEVGAPCPCGRGLPVLRQVVGRTRNMLTYPDGSTRWPQFVVGCRNAARYREIQLVQETVRELRLRVVPDGELTDADRAALVAALHRSLGHPFEIAIDVVDELRGAAGKLEEFVSHVSARPR